MDRIKRLLIDLTERLPELEWKISQLTTTISSNRLPRGLFKPELELTGSKCVAQIKADIQALSCQKSEHSANFLAEKIKQKINVLVALCQIESRKNKIGEKTYFGVESLSTRQQWIQSMEQDINILKAQQEAMLRSLDQMHNKAPAQALLSLKNELGEVERRLTLSSEALSRAVES